MNSENSTGADNQQETSQPRVPLDPNWIVGFVGGSFCKAASGWRRGGTDWRGEHWERAPVPIRRPGKLCINTAAAAQAAAAGLRTRPGDEECTAQGREAAGKSSRLEQYRDLGDELRVRLPASQSTFEQRCMHLPVKGVNEVCYRSMILNLRLSKKETTY